MKIYNFIIIIISSLVLIQGKLVSPMDKYDFYNYLKQNNFINKQLEIKVEGTDIEAYDSKQKYVYYTAVTYFGRDNVKSTNYTPYTTGNEFIILYKDLQINVDQKDIRTYLTESYNEFYKKESAKKIPARIAEILKNESEQVMICEYGLKKGKIYYAIFHEESYHINSPDGPKKRTNQVIWISDKPFIDGISQVDLTPNYIGWSY